MRPTRRTCLLLVAGLCLLAALGAWTQAQAGARRSATDRGVVHNSGWGGVAHAVSPNGARLAFTGAPESSHAATAPNGVRVTLDRLPGRGGSGAQGFVVY